jgi:hypothetical protein
VQSKGFTLLGSRIESIIQTDNLILFCMRENSGTPEEIAIVEGRD